MMAISAPGEGVFLEVNREFERVSGYSREEVVGKSAAELGLIAPEERERLAKVLGAGGPALGIEMLFRAKSGASRRCLCSMVPVRIGGVARTLALGIDVTGHARYEAERGLTIELLGLLNAPSAMREMMGTVERIRAGGELPLRGRRFGAGVPLRSGSDGRIQAWAEGCDGVRQLLDEQPQRSGERPVGRQSAYKLARPVPERRI
jgi:PAS domain S-box-containing protein